MLLKYNLGNTPNSNRIERIITDSNGYKLISFCRVMNFPKCKPQVSPSIFADFKDGYLRIFNRSDYFTVNLPSFKDAILFIRSFTDYSTYDKTIQ